MFFHTFHDAVRVELALEPDVRSAAATSSWYDIRGYDKAVAIVATNDADAGSANFDAKLRQATDSSGTGAKDVTNAAITQYAADAGNGAKAFMIELDLKKMDIANDFFYLAVNVTPSAALDTAAFLLLTKAKTEPVSNSNLQEVVTVLE